jgi:uncharacterized protein YceK
MRRNAIALAVLILAAACATALASTVTATSGALTGTLQAGTHHPKMNANWWVTVTAKVHGRAATATAYYQFLYNNQQVSKQYVKGNKNFHFHGSFRDNLTFPGAAVGRTLVVRVVVSAGANTVYLPYSVTTIR